MQASPPSTGGRRKSGFPLGLESCLFLRALSGRSAPTSPTILPQWDIQSCTCLPPPPNGGRKISCQLKPLKPQPEGLGVEGPTVSGLCFGIWVGDDCLLCQKGFLTFILPSPNPLAFPGVILSVPGAVPDRRFAVAGPGEMGGNKRLAELGGIFHRVAMSLSRTPPPNFLV